MRRDRLPTPVFLGFPCGSAGKESACNAGDLGFIPGLGRSPGEGKGYLLQCSGLENPMDSIVHVVAKSRTCLRRLHSHLSFVDGQTEKLNGCMVSSEGQVLGPRLVYMSSFSLFTFPQLCPNILSHRSQCNVSLHPFLKYGNNSECGYFMCVYKH